MKPEESEDELHRLNTEPPVLVELHVPDFTQAVEFYGLLGFSVARSEPTYRVLQRGRSVIALYGGGPEVCGHSYFRNFPVDTPRGFGVEIVIAVDDLDRACQVLGEKGRVVAPIQLRHWGCRDFRAVDPFGFYLRITEPWNPLAVPPCAEQ